MSFSYSYFLVLGLLARVEYPEYDSRELNADVSKGVYTCVRVITRSASARHGKGMGSNLDARSW